MDLLATTAALTGATRAERLDPIQTLWRGYGEVQRVALHGGPAPTVVVKHIRPPRRAPDRKVQSYAVEAAWYHHHAARVPARTATCFGSRHGPHGERIIVLEDLHHAGFMASPSHTQLPAVIRWLATLHAHTLGPPPADLWSTGTYWHLDARLAELAATPSTHWTEVAPELDATLKAARFQCLVHGDAKPANFLVDNSGQHAVAVDFQYIGGGPGVRDIVYLLDIDTADAPELAPYFDALRRELCPSVDGAALEAEWRALVPVCAADFQRFLAGWGRA